MRCLAVRGSQPSLGRPHCAEALDSLRDWPDEGDRAVQLAALAPDLPPALYDQAYADALRLPDPWPRDLVLAALAVQGGASARHAACAQALISVTTAPADRDSPALAALIPHLPPAQHAQALAAAEQSTDPWWRIQALAGLFPHLDHERREAAEQQAHACADRLTGSCAWLRPAAR